MKSFLEWLDQDGFYSKQVWDFETNKWSKAPGLVKLFDYQRRILGHCFTPNPDGSFPYTDVVYSAPKKSGKTTVLALIVEWFAECGPDGSEIYSCANDMEQAQSRAFSDIDYHVTHKLGLKTTAKRVDFENGTFIQVLAQHYASAAGSRQSLVIFDELWAYACTDLDTKIYTRQGWKTVDELQVGEDVATWKDGAFAWSPCEAVNRFPYEGKMVHLNHRRSDMLMTPNHRVLGRYRSKGEEKLHEQPWTFRRADEAMQAYEGSVPVAACWHGKQAKTLTIPGCSVRRPGGRGKPNYREMLPREVDAGDWLELFGYYISEGNICYTQRGGPPCGAHIAQDKEANPETYAKIQACLDRLGFAYSAAKNGFRVKDAQVAKYLDQFGKSWDKFIPAEYKELSCELLKRLMTAYLLGDGWVAGKGFQCHTVSEKLAMDMIEIGIKCGYHTRLMTKKQRNEREHTMYRVSFSKGNITYDRGNWSLEDYCGEVWCPTTANGTWLAMRNGFVFWTGNSEKSRRMWAEMTPPPTIENSMRVVGTYAGFENESDQLLDMYNLCFKKEGGKFVNGEVVPELADIVNAKGEPVCRRNGRTFIYWDSEPRLPWQNETYYSAQMQTLRPADFLRMHRNQWVSSNESFIPVELWDRAAKKLQGPITIIKNDPREALPISVGIDIGMKHDCSALVGVCYDASKRKVQLAFHKIWTPPQRNDKHAEMLDLEFTVEQELLALWKQYRIVSVVYDPMQFQRSAVTLARKGLPLVEFQQQGNHMGMASQNLYDLLKTGNLEVYPDPELRDHVRYAAAETTARGFRIVKGKNHKYAIDAAIALAMAAYDAVNRGGADTSTPFEMIMPFSDASGVHIPTISDIHQRALPEALRD